MCMLIVYQSEQLLGVFHFGGSLPLHKLALISLGDVVVQGQCDAIT